MRGLIGHHGRLCCNELWHMSITGSTALSKAERRHVRVHHLPKDLLQIFGDLRRPHQHAYDWLHTLVLISGSVRVSFSRSLSYSKTELIFYSHLMNLVALAPLRQVARTAVGNRQCKCERKSRIQLYHPSTCSGDWGQNVSTISML